MRRSLSLGARGALPNVRAITAGLLAGATLLLASAPTLAIHSGRIQGTIVDERGQPIEGALVTISGAGAVGTWTRHTDAKGFYGMPGLEASKKITIRVEAPGYVVREGREYVLREDQTLHVNFQLVRAESPSRAALGMLRSLLKKGQYSQAEREARALLTQVEDSSGRDSLGAAKVLDLLVEALWIGGKTKDPETRELARRALEIKEKALGPQDLELAESQTNLGNFLWQTGDYASAKPLYERALEIREKALGPDHPDVAASLNNLAVLLQATSNYAGAKPLYQRALEIREKALGPDHLEVAASLNNLAALMWDTGEQPGARSLFERALAIREKTYGPDHPEVAKSLEMLAGLIWSTGDYAGAKPLFERALAIQEKAFGAHNPAVAKILNTLASVLKKTGDYAGAKPLYQRALEIREKALGPDHLDVASSLNNLATLMWDTGDHAGARPLFERALAIREKTSGRDHPDVAKSLELLANLIRGTGDNAAARPLYERALTIWGKALGPEHLQVAETLTSLATLLRDMDDAAGARKLFERALAIREKALGHDDPLVASSLNSLAELMQQTGKKREAQDLYERARTINPTVGEPWYEHYEKAEEALKLQNWKRAVGEMNQALANRRDPAAHVKVGEARFINYHPYLRLGIAFYNLGQYDAALQAFNTEERIGAIAGSASDLKNLDTFRKLTQEAARAEVASEQESTIAIVGRILDRTEIRPPPKLPPIIFIANVSSSVGSAETPGAPAEPEEKISTSGFILSGLIVGDGPHLKVAFVKEDAARTPSEEPPPLLEITLSGEKVGGLYSYRFAQQFPVSPGAAAFRVVASDADGLSAEAVHRVRYLRPWSRSPWFYPALALLVGAALGAHQGYRAYRRHRLVTRRFNPYVAGAPVLDEDLFVGREPLLSRVLETIHNNSILLYGERRIGKTSLQHHLKRRLHQLADPDYDFYPVYIDLQGTPQERFFATLAEDIFEELAPILDGAKPGRDLPESTPYTYQTFVRDVHEVLKALKKRSPKKVRLVLLIDEVDELNSYDPRINQKLRSLFMKSFAEDLVAVVSGVGIKKHWASEGSPWYNFFEEIEVKPFTRRDAEELIERPIRGIFKFGKGSLDRLIENTDCKPYLIQKVCVALINRMHDEHRRTITVADVDAIGRPMEG